MNITIIMDAIKFHQKFGETTTGSNIEISRDCGLFMAAKEGDVIHAAERGGNCWLKMRVLQASTYRMDGHKAEETAPAKAVVTELNMPIREDPVGG